MYTTPCGGKFEFIPSRDNRQDLKSQKNCYSTGEKTPPGPKARMAGNYGRKGRYSSASPEVSACEPRKWGGLPPGV